MGGTITIPLPNPVSNCRNKARLSLINRISEKLNIIDTHGTCFDNPLEQFSARRYNESDKNQEHYFDEFLANYKIFLAFENSDCKDYITEKVWRRALVNGIIPVIRVGKYLTTEILEENLPKNSFIAFSEKRFDSGVEEIRKVIFDESEFGKYLKWRELDNLDKILKEERCSSFQESIRLCGLCKRLHSFRSGFGEVFPVPSSKVDWWSPDGTCDPLYTRRSWNFTDKREVEV